MARILVADDEPGLREFITDALELDGHDLVAAPDGKAAAKLLDERGFDLVITDLKMPGLDGMAILRKVRAEQPETEVIVMTAHGTVDNAVEAMKLGAFEYLQKPLSGPDELRLLVARAVHALGTRASKTFMAINCAALSEQLLESELFGHEKGAFTGATERKRGRLELADGGTFFLDEVGELKLELQAKLLRVLQERRYERVGGTRTLEVDVRWIAATNRDLRAMIDAGTFREDLYHRLAVFPIRLPPLRDRKADLLPIARSLLTRIAADQKRSLPTLSKAAEQRLLAASWRGNVRELANALERAAILADGNVIEPEHLWIDEPTSRPASGAGTIKPLVELEREAILAALAAVDGNRRRAAELLGIGERTLYDKLKKYGVD
jgi:two-component system response regulator FlrC